MTTQKQTKHTPLEVELIKLSGKHYMILGKQCRSVTSVFCDETKDSMSRFIASMIEPDITKVTALRKLVASMPDSWFEEVISKAKKFA